MSLMSLIVYLFYCFANNSIWMIYVNKHICIGTTILKWSLGDVNRCFYDSKQPFIALELKVKVKRNTLSFCYIFNTIISLHGDLLYLHKTLSVFGLFAEIPVAPKFDAVQVKIHPWSSRVTRKVSVLIVTIRLSPFVVVSSEIPSWNGILVCPFCLNQETVDCGLLPDDLQLMFVNCCSTTSRTAPGTGSIETDFTCTGNRKLKTWISDISVYNCRCIENIHWTIHRPEHANDDYEIWSILSRFFFFFFQKEVSNFCIYTSTQMVQV